MSKYILRLDDACEKRDIKKWDKIESLLGKYNIKPLVGVIPNCEDPMMNNYEIDLHFWDRVLSWEKKNWTIALHGYNHVYSTNNGGLNPVNKRSEFAGVSIEIQKNKIKKGVEILKNHGIEPSVFFAPSHTFDNNTLLALEAESSIRVISDTIATSFYKEGDFIFVPQQTGKVRRLPFSIVTFCYHPNNMSDYSFTELEAFIARYANKFISWQELKFDNAKHKTIIDKVLSIIYLTMHK